MIIQNQYNVSIGEVLIRFVYTDILPTKPLAAPAFFSEFSVPDIIIKVNIVDSVERIQLSNVNVKTIAWEAGNKNGEIVFNFLSNDVVSANLSISNDYSFGEINILAEEMHDVIPPMFVIVPILSGFLLKKECGFLFHGALIDIDGKGIILTGKSGAGKSTLSDFLKKNGYNKIGDDRLVVTLDEKTGKVFGHSTPYDLKLTNWVNKKSELKAIICLRHSSDCKNEIRELDIKKSISSLVLTNFMPLYAPEYINKHFQLFEKVLNEISLYQYSFLPNDTSVRYLEEAIIDGWR